ncbi:hypothetical protein [Cellulomonas composti]|uniref:hypothetical protein n=1 Tax=Cellulomonas composti TaxID=266130 RepID=UPI0011BE951A|nr:hypothetical protein [Cellulomonas composti]
MSETQDGVPSDDVPVDDVPVDEVSVDEVSIDDVPVVDEAVREALRLLDGLPERPLAEHVAVLDAVHGALQDRLAEAQG